MAAPVGPRSHLRRAAINDYTLGHHGRAELSMRTAFISGITGQDGRYLARTLLKRGFRVIGSTRGDPEAARRLVDSRSRDLYF